MVWACGARPASVSPSASLDAHRVEAWAKLKIRRFNPAGTPRSPASSIHRPYFHPSILHAHTQFLKSALHSAKNRALPRIHICYCTLATAAAEHRTLPGAFFAGENPARAGRHPIPLLASSRTCVAPHRNRIHLHTHTARHAAPALPSPSHSLSRQLEPLPPSLSLYYQRRTASKLRIRDNFPVTQ
ncbi:hypothetical protein HYPSUDRAFT_206342 [Hypholoma sublateritium FD-334 SS-4]|uniref:Uncharacterized protein n=1 Tax=Hypholoma sublateritium (strain FD-334 SS-4) TaxID=945553 RepID=A0A0D2KRN9_HYPSF|nr:hypothetical protein HYPSUDRAFT_206342 [Hypholoma sublateritium FD-334 SS-4]